MLFKSLSFVLLFMILGLKMSGQESMRDTLDGKLDASEFLKSVHGFLPLPQIITEPALGSFGLGIAPVFIKPNSAATSETYVQPTITAGIVGYTANKSWFTGLFRTEALADYGLKYRVGALYASINLDLYRELPIVGEKKFSFNFQTVPVFASITKRLGNSNIYAGFQYTLLYTKVDPLFDLSNLPEEIQTAAFETVQSNPGLLIEYDGRDNFFTPNKGNLVRLQYRVSAEWTGSDFYYQNIEFTGYQFFKLGNNLVSGFRAHYIGQLGDAPFFLLPSVNMRGVPAARYQGTQIGVFETEQRYDFNLRWSGVVFGGIATALSKRESFADADLIYNYGVGFRYLLARQFGLRMGVDLAGSNENFGYYLTFGSAWN